jgi:hypothetical protein
MAAVREARKERQATPIVKLSRYGRAWALVCVLALALWVARPGSSLAQMASADDYNQEKSLIAAISGADSSEALAAVNAVRQNSRFVSTLAAKDLDGRLARLLQWVVRDYASSGELRLLSAVPEGVNGAGRKNQRVQQLKRTYWLEDNAVYGAAALLEYVPPLGRILTDSWRRAWDEHFPMFCPDTESDVVVGQLAGFDGGKGRDDPRCGLPRPGTWEMLRMRQYPDPAMSNFDALPTPIIGTDYPADESGKNAEIVAIKQTVPRDLLKYGCLRQVLLGDRATARQMFDLALGQWDGSGFLEPKNRDPNGNLAGVFWTRDLAFAALCANALEQGNAATWGSGAVAKAALEQRLWSSQSATGGIWTNYCGGQSKYPNCPPAPPTIAKQTNEIAPLVLLAYGKNIWASSH